MLIEVLNVVNGDIFKYNSDIIPRYGDIVSYKNKTYRVDEVIHKVEEKSCCIFVTPINIKVTTTLN